MEITQNIIKEYFDYKDGVFFWKKKVYRRNNIGKVAGSVYHYQDGDYRHIICINSKRYFRSRLVFLLHNGYLPEKVDHENHNTLDDRIENLRAANAFQNNRNRKSAKNSSSKYLGVSFFKRDSKWMARIRVGKINKHLGIFDNEAHAALAYNREAVRNSGEFANINIINAP